MRQSQTMSLSKREICREDKRRITHKNPRDENENEEMAKNESRPGLKNRHTWQERTEKKKKKRQIGRNGGKKRRPRKGCGRTEENRLKNFFFTAKSSSLLLCFRSCILEPPGGVGQSCGQTLGTEEQSLLSHSLPQPWVAGFMKLAAALRNEEGDHPG